MSRRPVGGRLVEIRSVETGEVERVVSDVCALCFARRHTVEECDRPERFTIPTNLVD